MGKTFLILGAIGSFLIALLHVAIPIIGTEAYLACGGWWLLPLLEQGSPLPALLTLAIAAIFFIWTAYAFSGASLVRRLPLLRTGLLLISAIYLLRGADLIPTLVFGAMGYATELKFYFASILSLALGIFHLLGVIRSWKTLPNPSQPPVTLP
jgi:hypothetical protein